MLSQNESFSRIDVPEVEGTLELPPRFPIRWRWTMLVGFTVMLTVLVLSLLVLDMERDAWLENQESQAEILVERLGDELKIPMLLRSSAEVDLIVQGEKGFLKKVPDVLGIHIQYVGGDEKHFGLPGQNVAPVLNPSTQSSYAVRMPTDGLWYAKKVEYAGTPVGTVAVHFSRQAWEELAGKLVSRMAAATVLVVLMSSLLVYWIAGKMSYPMERLAEAAQSVFRGDYNVRLPVKGNDEISDATSQFNAMVAELAHKEDIRDVFGRYLNPKLVADVFEGDLSNMENHRQDVTVLFADMVGFTTFSETTETEMIVDILNKHFEIFHRIIDYYGGHVDKYIGDAVMAVFNHPNEDVDHVQHATMAGLAIAAACSKLGVLRENGEAIQFRVGLNQGQAIVGNLGAAERLEYTVIGDTVNVASRMGGLGEGGEVIMSEETFKHLDDEFNFDDMGEREVKGMRQPIRCGRVSSFDANIRRNISHAIALAFDLTLPSEIRQSIGDIDED